MCVLGEGQRLLLAEVTAARAEDSARSRLTWRGGYQEPQDFSRVSTLSLTLSVLLELATGKGLQPRFPPSASLSHCHQLFMGSDTRPPWRAGWSFSPCPAPPQPRCHGGPGERGDGQPGGRDRVRGPEDPA